MTRAAISEADSVYSCSSNWELRRHPVWHPLFRKFCLELSSLDRALGGLSDEEYWSRMLQPLKRYRFEMSAAPLPLNHDTAGSQRLVSELRKHLANCKKLYPTLGDAADSLVERFSAVSALAENPMLKFAEDILAAGKQTAIAILIKAPRLIPQVQEIIGSSGVLKHAVVIAPVQLREDACFGRLAVVGPLRWYPDHVLGAPRAKEIHVLHYGWIEDPWKPASVFVGSGEGGTERRERAHVVGVGEAPKGSAKAATELISATEVLPQINWERLTQEHSRRIPGERDEEDVEARMVLLEGGAGVFLDIDETSSALVIDLEEDEEQRVKRTPVRTLEPGMFLLLRTGGGGDFIPLIADKILGTQAARAREMQNQWKKLLRDACTKIGFEKCSSELRLRGADRANNGNLRRWMSYRSIRTQEPADFMAIMDFVGLRAKASEFWGVMELIASAHTKAGFHIRKLLLKEVLAADLTELKQLGTMEFELAEADCGSMTAFRVTDISPQVATVPAGRINHLFEA